MKIYQLHECSGEYECHDDRIVGTYFLEHRAKEVMAQKEVEYEKANEHAAHCKRCPYLLDNNSSPIELARKMEKYCDCAKIVYDDIFGVYCNNCYADLNSIKYYIAEVEVLE